MNGRDVTALSHPRRSGLHLLALVLDPGEMVLFLGRDILAEFCRGAAEGAVGRGFRVKSALAFLGEMVDWRGCEATM